MRAALGLGDRGLGDLLDDFGEHHLAVEGAVHWALRGYLAQALELLLGEVLGEAQDGPKRRRATALSGRVLGGYLHLADVPSLACRVHLHSDRGAGGEAGGQELLRAGSGVVPTGVARLVGTDDVVADPGVVAVPIGPAT